MSILNLQNVDLIFVALAIASIGVLGFSVFFNDRKSATNFYFFLFSIFTILWSSVNYFAYKVSNPEISFLLFRLAIFIAVWHSFLFFQTFFVFPKSSIIFPGWYKFILIPVVILVSLMNLTPFVFSEIGQVSSDGRVISIKNGPGIALFSLLIAFLIVGGLIMIFRKMIKSTLEDRRRYEFILIGVSITFILIITFNFILPAFFDNSQFVVFGALFLLPFVAFTSYAIIKHKLFNIRAMGAATLVFLLSIVSFFEVIVADSLTLITYRSVVFLLVLVFGILLIKSVLKEVKQREQIEVLNKELERAYAVEKKAKEDVSRAFDVEKRANEELQKLDKVKNDFLLTTQHDLRRPLTSVKWFLDMLVKGILGKQNKKTLEGAGKVQASVENSIEEVNNFLDIAQFQLGKSGIVLKPGIDLLPILDSIVNKLKSLADEKGISLTLEKPAKPIAVEADEVKLKAALSNIIDNAIKYTEKGSVTVSFSEKDANTVLITIKDTGIGIPKDKVKNIFESMFERTEDAKRTTSMGKGIGLHLSGEIIKGHNGKVWAESEGEGSGSTFYVELPVSANTAL